MKTAKRILFPVVCMIAIASCVPTRKYNAAVTDQQSWQQKYASLQSGYDTLQNKNTDLQTQLKSEQDQLNANQQTLSQQLTAKEKSLADLQALIKDQRDAIGNLKQEVCDAVRCFSPDQLKVYVKDGKLYVSMSDRLLFPSGSDVLNDSGKIAIADLAAVLNKSNLELMIEGHTDSVPIHNDLNMDNWDLSVRRATTVTRLFVKDGIPPQRLIAAGRSYFFPVATNETSDGRQQNRRTEIVLSPKLDKLWKLTEEDSTVSLK
jgi:chemotaxis protein MotB